MGSIAGSVDRGKRNENYYLPVYSGVVFISFRAYYWHKSSLLMNLTKRISNLWFWSSVSPEDVKDNPHSFVAHALSRQSNEKAYFAGFSEEEQSFVDSLNSDHKDAKLA